MESRLKLKFHWKSNDELTGLPLNHEQVVEGMKTEVKQLETLKVGRNMPQSEARKISREKGCKDPHKSMGLDPKDSVFGQMPSSCPRLRLGSRERIQVGNLCPHLIT